MRLDKILADKGLGSRSDVKELIRKGRIRVNGTVVKDSGMNVSDTDEIKAEGCDSFLVKEAQEKHWYMLNKPAGIVSATQDRRDDTVISLFKNERVKNLATVGRLDKDTEGLLLVTDDGELTHFLLSPSRHVPKTYFAKISGILKTEHVAAFEKGFEFSDFTSMPAKLEILSADETDNSSTALITVCEGKFHEVKRLVAAVGCEVTYLKRVAFGPLTLDDSLSPGEFRVLTKEERDALSEAAGRA